MKRVEVEFPDNLVSLNQQIEAIKSYFSTLTLDFETSPGQFGSRGAVLILVDAVLSMNRHYDRFVVPRVELVRESGIGTLDCLERTIRELGTEGFRQIWNYNHPARVEILAGLTAKFQSIKRNLRIEDDLDALSAWGQQSSVAEFEEFDVKGIGFTTFQYLRLLCGADTVKPDIHLQRAVKDALRKPQSKLMTVALIESTAHELGIPARRLDYAIWRYYSQFQSNYTKSQA